MCALLAHTGHYSYFDRVRYTRRGPGRGPLQARINKNAKYFGEKGCRLRDVRHFVHWIVNELFVPTNLWLFKGNPKTV